MPRNLKQLINTLPALGLVITSSLTVAFNPSTAQELCRDVGFVEPDSTTRTLELQQFGIRIKIPSNYRSRRLNDGTVEILEPGTFELSQCMARRGLILSPGGSYSFNIRLVPNPQNLSLLEMARQLDMVRQLGSYKSSVFTYNLDGTKVVILESESEAGAWFTVPGINGIVEMRALCDCEISKEDIVMKLNNTELIKQNRK